jgi:hypothetical protein
MPDAGTLGVRIEPDGSRSRSRAGFLRRLSGWVCPAALVPTGKDGLSVLER